MKCYDGCPDNELAAFLSDIAIATAALGKLNPQAHCTYFAPDIYGGSRWFVHEWGHQITGFHSTKIGALNAAINILKQEEK